MNIICMNLVCPWCGKRLVTERSTSTDGRTTMYLHKVEHSCSDLGDAHLNLTAWFVTEDEATDG